MKYFIFLFLFHSVGWAASEPLVTGIDGDVRIQRLSGKKASEILVRKESVLLPKDIIQTSQNAHARVQFHDSLFEMAPNSSFRVDQIQIKGSSKKPKKKITKWFFSLESGHVEFRIAKQSGGLDFKYGTISVSAAETNGNKKGAHGFVSTKPNTDLLVACLEGVLSISPQDISIVAGEAAEFSAKVSDFAPKPVGVGELKALRSQLGLMRDPPQLK